MKENHSSQNAQESGTSSFTRLRSKLSFERMVEMGAKMGMENPLFLCHERAAKATTVINGKEYINFSTYDYLDLNTHPEITEAVTEAVGVPTIGIGSGPKSDGQVLVCTDILGLSKYTPPFVKKYADISGEILKAYSQYVGEVRSGEFPVSSQKK